MSYLYQEQTSNSNKFLLWGIAFSILLHLLFIVIINATPAEIAPAQNVIDISFISPSDKKQEKLPSQMVTQPDNQEKKEEPATAAKLLSEKDSETEKEQIKRGDDPKAGADINKKSEQIAKNAETKPEQKMPAPKAQKAAVQKEKSSPARAITTLRLDNGTLLDKFSVPQSNPNQKNALSDPTNYSAFSRPPGSGAAFIGMRGSSDFLPNLPDGDITLLNTKADQFAVFVRRVATQVFSQMRRSGWEVLMASDIRGISDFCTVHAILDRQGNLIKVTIESPSGSRRFDEVLMNAARAGSRDPNPPEAALADDGNFHFIFKSRTWSEVAANAKNGAPFERRWLLLATGLL